ncbi:hypothetical protein GCK72_015750 [Caenorhabditis remanei]|uniref:Uncharacterized protein n=1 Tax=Caenorhabditis remanei TaxID=31234 RepID=A0A6A5GXC4_CAERE|nr:hypothetical protein GCK72_015750 [Caenorhabditis remanei]KAF1759286.1 hypothetical protein GCK72_015750 [Caenorhabditis remanei]
MKTLYGITVARNEGLPDKEKKALIELEQFMTGLFKISHISTQRSSKNADKEIFTKCVSQDTPSKLYLRDSAHVMQGTVLSKCIQETRRLDKTTQKKALRSGPSTQPRTTPCENPKWCKCNLVYASMIETPTAKWRSKNACDYV